MWQCLRPPFNLDLKSKLGVELYVFLQTIRNRRELFRPSLLNEFIFSCRYFGLGRLW